MQFCTGCGVPLHRVDGEWRAIDEPDSWCPMTRRYNGHKLTGRLFGGYD